MLPHSRPEQGSKRRAKRGAGWVGALVLGAGLAVSCVSALALRAWEAYELRHDFGASAKERVAALERLLGEQGELLHSVVSFYDSSETVTRSEFASFVSRGLERQEGTRALSWIRRVPSAERAEVEKAARDEGYEGFQFLERDPAGSWVRAETRSQHFVEWFREGQVHDSFPLGLDHASDPVVLAALERARDSGGLAATDPLGPSGRSLLAVLPVYEDGRVPLGSAARRAALTGFAVALLDVRMLLREASGKELPRGLTVEVTGDLGQPGGRLLFATPLPEGDAGTTEEFHDELEFGGRTWEVTHNATAVELAPHSWRPWGLLAVGALLSAILAQTVIATIGRARIGRVVRDQASQLARSGEELREGVLRRKEAEERSRSLEVQLRQVIDLVPHMIFVRDVDGGFLLVNQAAAAAFGRTVEALENDASIEAPGPTEWLAKRFQEGRRALELDQAVLVPMDSFTDSSGGRHLLRTVAIPYTISGDDRRAMLCVAVDITDRVHAIERHEQQGRVLSKLASGASLQDVLAALADSIEELVPGMLCSILLLDEDGHHLRQCIAPGLPAFYNDAIDGIEIGPTVGSCGAAAFLAERVVVEDVTVHPNWEPYVELAERAGVRACWSQPILSSEGRVMGTLAMYYREPRRPDEFELDSIESAANVAGIAIERFRVVESSKLVEEQLHQIVDLVPHMIFAKGWDGRFLMANRAVAEAYGRSVESLVGVHHADIHSERAEVERMLAADREVMSTGKAKVVSEEMFVDAQGRRRRLRTIRIPYSIRGCNQRAVLGVAMDMTEDLE